MIGYIQLHRKLLEWEWYHDVNTFKLFIHILLKANFEPKKWQGIEIKRGQLITSIKNLSNETGLTEKQVRNSIDKLVLTKEVGKQTTSQNTTLTILSYDLYQQEGKPTARKKANEGQTEGKRRANEGQQLNKDNKEDNDNKDNKIFDFKNYLFELSKDENLVNDFMLLRKNKKATNSETAFNLFLSEVEKSKLHINEVLKICISKDWKGFKNEWIIENKFNKNNNEPPKRHTIEAYKAYLEQPTFIYNGIGESPKD